MPKHSKPRAGSLQVWPRKKASKFLPSANWKAIKGSGILGLIAYKVGMTSCFIKDSTENSMTKDRRIIIPATVLEAPAMKILSVRFYKNGKVISEVISENLDKELKKVIKLPKKKPGKIEDVKDYDDARIVVYSIAKNTSIKKTPDIIELGLGGSLEEKINFVKEKLGKEILASDILKTLKLVDVRGLSKGKGIQGQVKRFGVGLRHHKSEKGVRKVGSIGPWHPARILFTVPMAGQLGMFTRISYNSKIISFGKIGEKNINPKGGWKNYGNVQSEYIILDGSVPGARKRALLLTQPLRATKKQLKKKYELLELR